MTVNISTTDRVRDFPNGDKAIRTFSDAEFERRLTQLRTIMSAQGIDAAIFTSYQSIKYYSDFLYTAFGRRYALVVTADRQVVISAAIDGGMPYRRCYGENRIYTDWQRDNDIHAIREFLRESAPNARVVGIEDDFVSLDYRDKLSTALGDRIVLRGISAAVMRQRMIKSAEEIELITDGARIADLGGEAVRAAVSEGASEWEVAAAGTAAMVAEIAAAHPHSEIRDSWVWFQSGINTDGAHTWPTTRTVERGDILSLNCFPMISGYYTALERTLFYGEPDARSLELWEANLAVHYRGLELITPGARCCDIADELNKVYAEFGLLEHRSFGYGHSFGVLSHYYGREAGLELREDIETVLMPGMVVSMEPMITIGADQPGAGGYREHDILVVTETGATNITGFPLGPDHNIIDA